MALRYYVLAILLTTAGVLFAQSDEEGEEIKIDIPEVSLLALQPDNSMITFYITFGSEAGDLILNTYTDNSKYLNYTVGLSATSSTQAVYAKISSGKLPKGVEFRLEASAYMGTGEGQLGSSTGEVLLSDNDQKIITGIGGSFTGSGSSQGHQLTYNFEVVSPVEVDNVDQNPLTITYTIADD